MTMDEACGRAAKTLDPRISDLSSIPAAPVMCKNTLGKLRIHIASGHSAIMGIWHTGPRLDRQLRLYFLLT